MEQQRRTFLKGAGATAFALAPSIRGFERQENEVVCNGDGTCWIEIYRSPEETQLTKSEIATAQRRVVRAYRQQSDLSEPISVGQIGRILKFPIHSFAYTIDAQGRSSFTAGGPEEEQQSQLTTARDGLETVTPPNGRTLEIIEEGPDVATRTKSAQQVTEELQETAKQSISVAAEKDLTRFGSVAETTTTESSETNRMGTGSASSPSRALALKTVQQGITVNNFLSLGVPAIEAKGGRILPRSRLGLDLTLPPRRGHHLVVQDYNIQPRWENKWRIQSAEVVHDWRSKRTRGINVVSHAPDGGKSGSITRGVSIGTSGPSASWTYSQPDVTRTDLTKGPKAKWQWHWNRGGRNSRILTVGSVASGNRPAMQGDHLVVVRSGVTFRQPPSFEHPFGQKQKIRIAQAFRYE